MGKQTMKNARIPKQTRAKNERERIVGAPQQQQCAPRAHVGSGLRLEQQVEGGAQLGVGAVQVNDDPRPAELAVCRRFHLRLGNLCVCLCVFSLLNIAGKKLQSQQGCVHKQHRPKANADNHKK